MRWSDGYRQIVDPALAKPRFKALLGLDDHQLPLDEMCLLLCRLAGFEIDIVDEQRKLVLSAVAIPPTFEDVMAHLFQGPAAIRGNTEDYYNISNSMLSEVHRTGLGLPITLSVLAMELGRRVGVEIVGVGMPGHFLVRSANDDTKFADPFGGGRILDSDGARTLFARITNDEVPWRENYLAPVSNRNILFRVLNNIRVACAKSPEAAPNLPWVLELISWFPQGDPFDAHAAGRAMARFN